jgi:hypothetical protein
MVNTINVSRYDATNPPLFDGEKSSRKLPRRAIYPKADVRAILSNGGKGVALWTRSSQIDAARLGLENCDIAQLIEDALNRGRYTGSEWCEQKPSGPCAACDVYTLSRMEWNDELGKDIPFDYYFKFAISKTGTILLVVSCHESRDKS